MRQINVNELFMIVGHKEVEIQVLKSALESANQEILGLKNQLGKSKNKTKDQKEKKDVKK